MPLSGLGLARLAVTSRRWQGDTFPLRQVFWPRARRPPTFESVSYGALDCCPYGLTRAPSRSHQRCQGAVPAVFCVGVSGVFAFWAGMRASLSGDPSPLSWCGAGVLSWAGSPGLFCGFLALLCPLLCLRSVCSSPPCFLIPFWLPLLLLPLLPLSSAQFAVVLRRALVLLVVPCELKIMFAYVGCQDISVVKLGFR